MNEQTIFNEAQKRVDEIVQRFAAMDNYPSLEEIEELETLFQSLHLDAQMELENYWENSTDLQEKFKEAASKQENPLGVSKIEWDTWTPYEQMAAVYYHKKIPPSNYMQGAAEGKKVSKHMEIKRVKKLMKQRHRNRYR